MRLEGLRVRNKDGFTLIEILVSIAILGIGLGMLLELFSGGLKSARVSEEYTKAVCFGKGKMEEMLTTRDFSEGVTEGTFDDQFSWKIEVKKSNPSLGQANEGETKLPIDLYQIVVRVIWKSGRGERNFEMESLRAFKGEEGKGEKS
jgi:general secretion pathway protein I